MQGPTTLRGIFPERKVAYRRNFIKENVRKIKQIQVMVQQVGLSESKLLARRPSVMSKGNVEMSKTNVVPTGNALLAGVPSPPIINKIPEGLIDPTSPKMKMSPRRPGIQRLDIKPRKDDVKLEEKIIHRSMQTETSDNIQQIYSTGTIKYPSPSIVMQTPKGRNQSNKNTQQQKKGNHGYGDTLGNNEDINKTEKDFLKENMAVKPRMQRKGDHQDPNKPPPTYKRGVVPKYIKQKKDVAPDEEGDVECPSGHVLLPDEERKETLKVLRESYADKIQELNSMPVRSDTLRMQKRKMELEEDLKKIDEGIKVFQRPKVFVKINV